MIMQDSTDYDEIAPTYDRRYVENDYGEIDHTLLDFVTPPAERRVLEVGCGTGHWLALLDEWGCRAAGLDPSAAMLRCASNRPIQAMLVQGRAEHLPFPPASFDRIVCVNAFHHFADKERFLSEARKVLRPEGGLMTVGLDPHTHLDSWYIYDYFEGTLKMGKKRYPPCDQIREWMEGAGFVECTTMQAQHVRLHLNAREALESGQLDKSVTSHLAMLSQEEYAQGIEAMKREIDAADARGQELQLRADLRLYLTQGSVGG